MTTRVLDPESVATTPPRRTASRNPFFAVMSAAILLIVIGGFTPTLYLRPVFNPPAIPGYLFLHGIVLTSWFVWLVVQTLLIRSGRTALHRRVGLAGAVLAAAVPFAGLMATIQVPGRIVASGIDLDADVSALVGLGLSGVTVVRFLSNVVWGNLTSAVSFAVLAWTGILLRRRPAAHKRLMLLATIAILGPALARLARLPVFGGSEQGIFEMIVTLSLLGAVIVYDVATTKRLHPATILGISFPLGSFFLSTAIAGTEVGLGLVRWLAAAGV